MDKNKLKEIVEDNTSSIGRWFDNIIQTLIILSLISFSVGTIPDNSIETTSILNIIETICVCLFLVEYLLRLYVSSKPLKYIFSFYGIIDLIAILPYFLSLSIDLRSIRLFRVFRAFRAFKMVRYNEALKRLRVAFGLIKEELMIFLIAACILIYISAVGIYFFENEAQPEIFKSVIDSLWWSVVTLTTVGYGDMYPITIGGKMFTFGILIVGIGIISIPAGLISSGLTAARKLGDNNI